MANQEGITGFLEPIRRDIAFLLFDKLKSSRATVWCGGELYGWDFQLTGRVENLTSERVELTSLDGKASMSVWLDRDDLSFWYTEPSVFPEEIRELLPDSSKHAVFIGVKLPFEIRFRNPDGEEVVKCDKLFFAELTEESDDGGEAE